MPPTHSFHPTHATHHFTYPTNGTKHIPPNGINLHNLQYIYIYIYIYTHTHTHMYIYMYVNHTQHIYRQTYTQHIPSRWCMGASSAIFLKIKSGE